MEKKIRLDKYLSLAGIGTRNLVKGYIYQGQVKVNGVVIQYPAYSIDPVTDSVEYLNRVILNLKKEYYMFHKPSGVITARTDETEKTVMDFFDGVALEGLFPVGRLDKDTEGLLLITNDGDFNHQVMYPGKHIQKTYFFFGIGKLTKEETLQLEQGIDIGYGSITKPAKLEITCTGKYEEFETVILKTCKEVVNREVKKGPIIGGYLTISEGRKHQVKRMLRHFGCHVFYLKRISIGNLLMDETLKKGEFRKLTHEELKEILSN